MKQFIFIFFIIRFLFLAYFFQTNTSSKSNFNNIQNEENINNENFKIKQTIKYEEKIVDENIEINDNKQLEDEDLLFKKKYFTEERIEGEIWRKYKSDNEFIFLNSNNNNSFLINENNEKFYSNIIIDYDDIYWKINFNDLKKSFFIKK